MPEQILAEATTFVPASASTTTFKSCCATAMARGALCGRARLLRERQRAAATGLRRKGGLDWRQEEPNLLVWSPLGDSPRMIRRGTAAMNTAGQRVNRIPPGHPEGYLEAFATIYNEVAAAITARRSRSPADPSVIFRPSRMASPVSRWSTLSCAQAMPAASGSRPNNKDAGGSWSSSQYA